MRQAVVMVSGFLVGCGLTLEDFIISTSTCQRTLTDLCGGIGSKALETYVDEVKGKGLKVFCHFDSKIIEEDFEGKGRASIDLFHSLAHLLSPGSNSLVLLLLTGRLDTL